MRHMKQYMTQVLKRHPQGKPARTTSFFLHTNHNA